MDTDQNKDQKVKKEQSETDTPIQSSSNNLVNKNPMNTSEGTTNPPGIISIDDRTVLATIIADLHIQLSDREFKLRAALEEKAQAEKKYLKLLESDEEQKSRITNLMVQLADAKTQYEEVSRRCQQLEAQNAELKQQIADLHKKLGEQQVKIDKLEINLNQTIDKISSVSLREAMRVLDNYLVREILGSKNQMIKHGVYTINQVAKCKEPTIQTKYIAWQNGNPPVSVDDINYIKYFKETGDTIVHKEWRNRSKEELHSPKDGVADIQQSKEKMLELLENYCSKEGVDFGYSFINEK